MRGSPCNAPYHSGYTAPGYLMIASNHNAQPSYYGKGINQAELTQEASNLFKAIFGTLPRHLGF